MIVGFEKQTHNLTPQEETILPLVKERLEKARGKSNSVTSKEIIVTLEEQHSIKLDSPRFRKIVNYIRLNKIVPNLLSNSLGYYVSDDKKEIDRYVRSLTQRIDSITAVRDSLVK